MLKRSLKEHLCSGAMGPSCTSVNQINTDFDRVQSYSDFTYESENHFKNKFSNAELDNNPILLINKKEF